jgi:nucleotide-binding universal stress UspA family protein
MDIRLILLALPTYPDLVPERTVESAFRMAEILGARMTVQVPQLNSDRSTWPAVMGAFPLDFPRMMQDLVGRSEANAAASCACVERLSVEYGVKIDLRRAATTLYASAAGVTDLARLHDLLILPVPEIDSFDRAWLEAAIFQAGRPVLLLPSGGKSLQSVDRVVVAWDYSREAARALGDALPILRRARNVHVVTILGEKDLATRCVAADVEAFLASHQVPHSLEQLTAGNEPVSGLLLRHAREINAGMLVMGCYGHGRMQEFLLGGATRGVIRNPALPVLLSH